MNYEPNIFSKENYPLNNILVLFYSLCCLLIQKEKYSGTFIDVLADNLNLFTEKVLSLYKLWVFIANSLSVKFILFFVRKGESRTFQKMYSTWFQNKTKNGLPKYRQLPYTLIVTKKWPQYYYYFLEPSNDTFVLL
jgi:hypothetical protein